MKILAIDRYIIEVIGREKIGLDQIFKRTSLDKSIVIKTVQNLLVVNLIDFEENLYSVNFSELTKYNINEGQKIRFEFYELMNSIIDLKISNEKNVDLKFKKVWMRPSERMMYDELKSKWESFINGLSDKFVDGGSSEVVLWGRSSYEGVINRLICD